MPPDMTLKRKLASGHATIGSWITLAHPAIAEIMVRAGFDWLVLDMEHSALDLKDIQSLVRVIDLAGGTPIVRLPVNDETIIKRVMDTGAHGIMVPMVNTPEDAERAVASMRYPPHGRRGVGLARAQGYGASFAAYRDWLEREAVVIVMLEHVDAARSAEAILSVDGVDGYIIGPYDLSGSLGVPGALDDPRVAETVEAIRLIGEKTGTPGGMHVVEPDLQSLRAHLDRGFRFMGYTEDIRILDTVCRRDMAAIRERIR